MLAKKKHERAIRFSIQKKRLTVNSQKMFREIFT